MNNVTPDHPLYISYKAWKAAEETNTASLVTYTRETGDIRHRAGKRRSTKGLPQSVSSRKRELDQTMVNIRRRQYEDELEAFLTEHPGISRKEVENILEAQTRSEST